MNMPNNQEVIKVQKTINVLLVVTILCSVILLLGCSHKIISTPEKQISGSTKTQEAMKVGSEMDINEKVNKIIPGTTTRKQVIEVFGSPKQYIWGDKTFSETELPNDNYIMDYMNARGVNFWLIGDKVNEVRIESNESYSYKGKLHLGSSIEDVTSLLGEPANVIIGKPIGWEDKVLYKDIEGNIGHCYIDYKSANIRMFFGNYKVAVLYLYAPE
jgi:hypothetical protein